MKKGFRLPERITQWRECIAPSSGYLTDKEACQRPRSLKDKQCGRPIGLDNYVRDLWFTRDYQVEEETLGEREKALLKIWLDVEHKLLYRPRASRPGAPPPDTIIA
ncbi:hypothetical protein L209DRAFT_714116, partial [Thermothelomyces heterothallicus CBS 203.75]